MKKLFLLQTTLLIVFCTINAYAQYSGYYRTSSGNTNFHHFTRNGSGAAVYINQQSTNASHPILRLSSGTASANQLVKFTVENNGNVGIGTSNPLAKLELYNGNILMRNLNNTDNNSAIMVAHSITSGTHTTFGTSLRTIVEHAGSNKYGLQLFTQHSYMTGQTEKVRITGEGRVGIGTTDPQGKLDVFGGNIILGSNTNDVGDIIFNRSGGNQVGRIWTNNTGSSGMYLSSGDNSPDITINSAGNVLISGNTVVYGKLEAKEIKVTLSPTADFVFANDYRLRSLSETEAFIQANHHLPEIASATEMVENGVNMAEFQIQLLQKIEEMTLHMIQQQKEIEELKSEIKSLK